MLLVNQHCKSVVKVACSLGVALLCLSALVVSLYHHYEALQAHIVFFSPIRFSVSLFPLLASYLVIPSMWCRILASSGMTLSYRKAFCIQYISHIGRYIPGKVWAYLAQTYFASKEHISPAETLRSNITLMYIMNISSIIVWGLSFCLWDVFPLPLRCVVAAASLLLLYDSLRSHVLERTMQVVIEKVTRKRLSFIGIDAPYGALLLLAFFSWIVFAAGLCLMVTSFYEVNLRQGCILVGSFAISWLLGYYALLSPGGLGVQEGIHVYLLTLVFPWPVAIVIALASRLWVTLGDALAFCVAIALKTYDDRLQRPAYGDSL